MGRIKMSQNLLARLATLFTRIHIISSVIYVVICFKMAHRHMPAIIAGDLNADPANIRIEPITTGMWVISSKPIANVVQN